ncbi:hypothetical protein LXA43DRAFT_1096847 [Ganoderma leucocontextum]|nr:hypothetical protein LXA43DRAFT_1096847 [Ganoderma leucocontextum]
MLNILYLLFSLRTVGLPLPYCIAKLFSKPTMLRIRSPSLNPSCYVVVFIGPAATILVNRFLIHIQEVNKHMVQGLDCSEDESMQSPDHSLELRFTKTFPQDRPATIITHASHGDFVQPMDSAIYQTTTDAHV